MNPELRDENSLRNILACREEPECKRAFADFYWHVLLYGASIIVVAAVVFSVWELSAVLRNWEAAGSAPAEGVRPIPALNKIQLKDALEKFQARAQHFESLKASPPEIKDPSR